MNHVTDERTDRPLDRHLHDWFASSIDELPDGLELPSAIRSDVLSRLPGTPQRRRWWPFRWRPFRAGATRSADREEPRPEGRPRPMFDATRVAAVVAALALAGSLAYMALPAAGPATAPGAQRDAADFAGFTGTFTAHGCEDGELTVYDWGHSLDGDYCAPMTIEVSDERLNGAARAAHNAVRFVGGPVYGVRTLSAEIVNDEGTWDGAGIAFHDPSDKVMRYELLLSGHGDYDGLSAMLSLVSDTNFQAHDAEGVVFPGELPPYPVFDGADPDFEPAIRSEIDPSEYGGYEGEARLSAGSSDHGTTTAGAFGYEAREAHYSDMTVETTDPRMSGMQETFHNSNDFGFGDGVVHTTTDRIVTDDGWWGQSSWGYTNPETGTTHFVNQLTGHGAYEGLSAVDFATQESWGGTIELDGVIFPGELPAYPEKLEPIE